MITFTSTQLDLWLAQAFWPFCRILTLLMVVPVLSHTAIPARVKIGLAMVLAAVVAPTLTDVPPLSLTSAPLLFTQQLLIGCALGFSLRVVFAAAEMAGDLIGLQMGLSFASFVDPLHNAQTPLLGSLLGTVTGLTFLAINGHLIVVSALVESFQAFPIATSGDAPLDLARLVAWGGEIFRMGLHLALPVLATLLILNLGLGVLARTAPQLNLFAMGFPVTLLTGLLVFAAALPFMAPALQAALERAARF